MILDTIDRADSIFALHPLYAKLFAFVRTHDLASMPAGRITIDGEDLYINLSDAALRTKEEQKLEVHHRYVDVHFPLDGEETVGWSPVASLKVQSDAPFDAENDFALYSQPADTYFTVRPGEFYVMDVTDAHAPIIGQGTLKKAVAKVRIR